MERPRSGSGALAGFVGFLASLIAIFVFVTGKESLPAWAGSGVAPFASEPPPSRPHVANVGGTWRGVLTQTNQGLASEYDYEVFLTQDGNSIEGSSTLSIPRMGYSGTLRVRGTISGTRVRFEDVAVSGSNLPHGSYWCQKLVELDLAGGGELRGSWRQDGCGWGDIALARQ